MRLPADEKHRVFVGRIMVLAGIVVAGYFGVNPPGFVGQVVALAFGLAAASFFPVIVLGIFSKRVGTVPAITGMVVGIGFTASYIIYFKFVNPAANTKENWWFGISPEGIGTLGMLFNFAVAFIVSALTPKPPKDVVEMIESIRKPEAEGEELVVADH